MYYCPGFDLSQQAVGTLTMATAGQTDIVLTLASDLDTLDLAGADTKKFFHSKGSAANNYKSNIDGTTTVIDDWGRCPLGSALQVALRAAATANSWTSPTGITVDFAQTGYTIAYSVAVFSLTWSTSEGRRLFGFSGNSSGAQTYSSNQTPWFMIVPTLPAVSGDPTPDFEPENIANLVMPDAIGSGFGLTREAAPQYSDWVQEYETKEKTIHAAAVSTHPYNFQRFFQDVRTIYPFLVTDAADTTLIYKLRPEGSAWRPQRATPGNDAQFHIPFKALSLGTRYLI